jgi:hypothetical protein
MIASLAELAAVVECHTKQKHRALQQDHYSRVSNTDGRIGVYLQHSCTILFERFSVDMTVVFHICLASSALGCGLWAAHRQSQPEHTMICDWKGPDIVKDGGVGAIGRLYIEQVHDYERTQTLQI